VCNLLAKWKDHHARHNSGYKISAEPPKGNVIMVWPWQAFDWGVFWAILAAALVCLIAVNIINAIIGRLSE
jgi:hypothetical protein